MGNLQKSREVWITSPASVVTELEQCLLVSY